MQGASDVITCIIRIHTDMSTTAAPVSFALSAARTAAKRQALTSHNTFDSTDWIRMNIPFSRTFDKHVLVELAVLISCLLVAVFALIPLCNLRCPANTMIVLLKSLFIAVPSFLSWGVEGGLRIPFNQTILLAF